MVAQQPAPRRGDRRAAARAGARRIADDVALARRLRRGRFDLALDLHGGPRSRVADVGERRAASGSATTSRDAAGCTRGSSHRAPDLRPRHSVVNQWDLLEAIPGWPGGTADPRARSGVEMAARCRPRDARMADRLARAGVAPDDELVVAARERGQPVPAMARSRSSRRPRRRWPRACRGGGWCFSSGPSDREAASRIAADRARPGLGRGRPHRRSRRIRPAGAQSADRPEPAVRRRRHRAAAHRGAPRATPVVGIYGLTLAARSAPWRPRAVPTLSVETAVEVCRAARAISGSARHGDFRCLTQLAPARRDRGGGTVLNVCLKAEAAR